MPVTFVQEFFPVAGCSSVDSTIFGVEGLLFREMILVCYGYTIAVIQTVDNETITLTIIEIKVNMVDESYCALSFPKLFPSFHSPMYLLPYSLVYVPIF